MEKKVSIIIPAHNEEENILKVLEIAKNSKCVNEIIVVDNASTDNTKLIAEENGIKVISCKELGKGLAMKKGLQEANNRIIAFIDADIPDYLNDLIDKIINPVLEGRADFVKTRFDREGGRVTELVAKPMLELLFPEIYNDFSQPLSGMISGKVDLFNKLEFEDDYGVDVGILIDIVNLDAKVEEVYIGEIKNNSKDWKDLVKMSKEVQKAILKRSNKIDIKI